MDDMAASAAENRCANPCCAKPLTWPAPGLCSECLDRVCLLRDQQSGEETEDANAE